MSNKKKSNLVIQVLAIIGIVVLVNVFGGSIFSRFDLTDDQRHTISEVSEELVVNLKHPAFVTIYFGGDLPPYYETYEEGMENLLSEMSIASDGMFDYQFIDPSNDPEMLERFRSQGFPAIPLSVPKSFTSQEQVLVLPYAEINYQDRTSRINLIQNSYAWNQEGSVDIYVGEALRRFEYAILSEVYNLSRDLYKTVGLLKGHGEYPKESMGDLYRDTDRYYNFIEVDLSKGKPIGPSILDLLLVLQPDSALSEREKYEIDQYLMRGGRAIFLMNLYNPDFSAGDQVTAFSFARNTNLDDLFMKNGVKLQYNLLNDPSHGKLAMGSFAAALGPENVQVNWPFFPKIWDLSSHPTTRYLGKVLMRYASSIDTFYTEGVQHTVLMRSSTPTRIRESNPLIDINSELQLIKQGADRVHYKHPGQITGVLVEGTLQSLYQNRPIPTDSLAPEQPINAFISRSPAAVEPKYVLISDGEFAKGIRGGDGQYYLPLENKILLANLFDYLTDQDILTRLRPRAYNDRMLDPQAVLGNQFSIQLLNIGLPLLLVICFGIGRTFLRRRRNRNRMNSTAN